MMRFLTPILAFVAAFSFLMPEASAQLIQPGLDNAQNIAAQTGSEGSFRILAVRIVNFFLGFLGLVAVFLLIYAGFLYMTSAGGDTEKAKKILIYTGVGIIVILLSFAIVNTVIQSGLGGVQ